MIAFGKDGLESSSVLGTGGLISQAYTAFEARPQQLAMAHAVELAMRSGGKLAVEAGTGVGKSFAYLIPAIDQVVRKNGKVLISTYTITLQEQLINKDIPFLLNILPVQFNARLAKGRNNYLCLRRLDYALKRQRNLFDADSLMLSQFLEWSQSTKDGSLSDLPFAPAASLWDAVKSEHGNCSGRKCRHFRSCFYWQARRQLECADIIIGNHAILFSDLILKDEGASLLPDYKFIVLDEAHNLEQAAEDHFGIDISNHTFIYLLNSLYNSRIHKGLLALNPNARDDVALVKKCSEAVRIFFRQVEAWYKGSRKETNGRTHPGFVDDCLSEPLRKLRLAVAKLANDAGDDDDKYELTAAVSRCKALETELSAFLTHSNPAGVYWVEVENDRRRSVSLRSAPLNVGPDVRRVLFDKYDSVILTSATLSTAAPDRDGGFEFFMGRIGLVDAESIKLGSPFDYKKCVTIYIEPDLPEPNVSNFDEKAADAIKKYIRLTHGKAFVLFTSYTMLNSIAGRLESWFDEQGITLLRQGSGIDRSRLLAEFKQDTDSVLFGTDSFWQGVDVPGEALSNVIIVRLPFAVPSHPLLQGRLEQIKQEGGNAFFDYQLPQAIIKFKQGFGRLIRTKDDRGIVVILDSRVVNKNYGREFLAAIPACTVRLANNKGV